MNYCSGHSFLKLTAIFKIFVNWQQTISILWTTYLYVVLKVFCRGICFIRMSMFWSFLFLYSVHTELSYKLAEWGGLCYYRLWIITFYYWYLFPIWEIFIVLFKRIWGILWTNKQHIAVYDQIMRNVEADLIAFLVICYPAETQNKTLLNAVLKMLYCS